MQVLAITGKFEIVLFVVSTGSTIVWNILSFTTDFNTFYEDLAQSRYRYKD